jgi:hypothetical protein
MTYFHGTPDRLSEIDGRGFYITADRAAAESYALENASEAYLYTIAIAPGARIASLADVRDAIEAVKDTDRESFNPDDYSDWKPLEFQIVRDCLAARDFHGARVSDVTPDGRDHDSVLIWDAATVTIAAEETVTAADDDTGSLNDWLSEIMEEAA